jgi:hypothetical protein
MRLAARLLRGAFVFTLLIPLGTVSCTQTACFEWNTEEGACPAQEDALSFFQDTSCHFSEIKTVDSEADFVNEACCYEVTEWSPDEERILLCN